MVVDNAVLDRLVKYSMPVLKRAPVLKRYRKQGIRSEREGRSDHKYIDSPIRHIQASAFVKPLSSTRTINKQLKGEGTTGAS